MPLETLPLIDEPCDLDMRLSRAALLLGSDAMRRLRSASVIVMGLGGVGSWAAEALARTGVGHITLVDADIVAPSNINRQLMATVNTIGLSKADTLHRRLLAINPDARIEAITERFTPSNASGFNLFRYDCIIDAIDSLADKAYLMELAADLPHTRLFSSMGAACRVDPGAITTGLFPDITGDALAAALRHHFRRHGKPLPRCQCVYSREPRLPNHPEALMSDGSMTFGKAVINGALCHITAIFGMTLASLALTAITNIKAK